MRVRFEVFRGTFTTWQDLFQEAADFANRLDPRQVITISHSADKGEGVVTVWYWGEDPEPEPEGQAEGAAAEGEDV
jgi:hypothetical protein